MKSRAGKIWSIVSTVLIVLIVLFAIFLLFLKLSGYRAFNVLSDSMDPEYSKGDLIFVRHAEKGGIKKG